MAVLVNGVVLSVYANDGEGVQDIQKPVLTVTTATPKTLTLTNTLSANGDVAAWQEASIGNETDGLRLTDVRANVGDQVKRGQVLATFASAGLAAGLTEINARVTEARVVYENAARNAQRARRAKTTGAWSEQEVYRYLTEEHATKARLEALQASATVQKLRLQQTQILAPDDGIISSRSATVGAVLPMGQELFRLIRQNRLEWRAEVASAELVLLQPGTPVRIKTLSGSTVLGTVRVVAPTIDPRTRLGLVYTDLPYQPELKTGMYLNGQFELGKSNALTVMQQAVVMRDGFSYVFRLEPSQRVVQVKVATGRRCGDHLEILTELQADAELVTSGAGFLSDGDLVQVANPPAPAQPPAMQAC